MHLLAFEEHLCQPSESRPLVEDFLTPDDHTREEREVDHRVFARQVEAKGDTGVGIQKEDDGDTGAPSTVRGTSARDPAHLVGVVTVHLCSAYFPFGPRGSTVSGKRVKIVW